MHCFEEVAIVGGGPAGAFCAFELAKQGFSPVIFDHSHPREKPCGGGISPSVIAKFPFVEGLRGEGRTFGSFDIVSCIDTPQVTSCAFENGFAISRRVFDQAIMKMATDSGGRLIEEKIVSIIRQDDMWVLHSNKSTVKAKLLVGADGVFSIVRRQTVGAISREHLALTFGYYALGGESRATIKFLAEIPGYIWAFPGKDAINVGIGSQLRYGSKLKPLLDGFIESNLAQIKIVSSYAACLPSASNPQFFNLPCAGRDWLLVGDAAGHVDPISGGGILYALWGAKLAAQAIGNGDVASYDTLWRRAYGTYLMESCRRKDAYYDPLLSTFSIIVGLAKGRNFLKKGQDRALEI
jgi:geranylgeranyl reductase family protein